MNIGKREKQAFMKLDNQDLKLAISGLFNTSIKKYTIWLKMMNNYGQ